MQQRLTPQQIASVLMLEMPLAQMEERVQAELESNPSLTVDEGDENADSFATATVDNATEGDTDNTENREHEDREDALAEALENFGQDDRMDTVYSDDYVPSLTHSDRGGHVADESMAFQDSDVTSFLDTLREQMGMEHLSQQEQTIMEYLIGSLDDDGLLRKDPAVISDELTVYYYLYVSAEEVLRVLKILQTFEPAGIGARTLQECLLLQVDRREDGKMTTLLRRMLTDYYDDFINKRMQQLQRRLDITDYEMENLWCEVRRLNPKPGASMGESQGRSLQQITPDFIVTVDYEGHIALEVNTGRVPALHVVGEDTLFLEQCQKQVAEGRQMSRGEQEAMLFTKKNVERANDFIIAMRMRHQTLTLTMKAIIDIQRSYFLEGDESDIRPMKLQDVAERTGLDLSTISRVCRSKYVQTPWGVFSLRHFFSDAYTTDTGDTISTKKIKSVLREVVGHEDPQHPLSDERLHEVLKEKGLPIARRTVAKYREQLGIPAARLRKALK